MEKYNKKYQGSYRGTSIHSDKIKRAVYVISMRSFANVKISKWFVVENKDKNVVRA